MLKFFLARLKEPSTWRGIVMLATGFGVALTPDQANAVVAVGVAIVGLIGVLTADQPKLPPQPERETEQPSPNRARPAPDAESEFDPFERLRQDD